MNSRLLLLVAVVQLVVVERVLGGAPACVDKNAPGRASDCPNVAYLCRNPAYATLMADQCPLTCGLCNAGGGNNNNNNNGNCVDKNAPGRASDCPRLVAYCTNPIYKPLMDEECPKTCGTCGQGGTDPETTTTSY
ncbi:hypothetical protein M3Y99_00114000 [Aphelenchoides fujianensis]|nr:hypothetical protein M3Y99_00114000 [Aphelenchoides fujianensis]